MHSRHRGIALILTLMVAAILCMLAGAFMGVNQGNIRLISSQEVHYKALQAAQTGIEYAKMRMEQNGEWGDPKRFNPDLAKPPETEAMRVVEKVEGNDVERGPLYKVVGVLNGGESHFQILLVDPTANNLAFRPLEGGNGFYAPELIASKPGGSTDDWGSMTCTNIDISVNYSAFKPSDPLLHIDPLYPVTNNPPAYANATNRVIRPRRARIVVLGYCKGIMRKVEASFGPVELSDCSLAAGGDMAVSVSTEGKWTITSTDGENQVKALGSFYGPAVTAARQGIQFGDLTPGGSVRATGDIHLTDDLELDYNNATDTISITGGGPALTAPERDAAGALAKGEFLEGTSGVNLPPVEPEDVENLAGISNSNKKTIRSGRYEFVEHNKVNLYDVGGDLVTTYTDRVPAETGGGTAVYLKDGKFIIPNQHQVSVEGTLKIESTPGIKPKVAIGFNQDGWLPWKATGVLSVAGDLYVNNGTVVGAGSVVASGDGDKATGRVTIAGKSDMTADPDVGITMYANSTVNITPPQPGTFQKIDFKAFKNATSNFNAGNWTANKQMNHWGKLDIEDKQSLVGNLTPSVVNDTQVTDAGPSTTGAIRTTDITSSLGALDQPGSVLNVLVNQYDFVADDPGAMANVTAIIETYKSGTGTINGVETDVGSAGISVGRYLRLREWLQMNNEFLKDGLATSEQPLSDNSWQWADCSNTTTNGLIGHKVIQQLDYYERQRGGHGDNLEAFFTEYASNPISSETVDASFKGLIFSNSNIFCDLANGSFFVDGGMVARKALAVSQAKNVFTKYNPIYMKALTRELYAKKGWRRMSIVYWATL